MNKVIMMSYKDYAAVWEKFQNEGLGDLLKPLPADASEERKREHHAAYMVARLFGTLAGEFYLRMTGTMPAKLDNWEESEELFDATKFTTRMSLLGLCKLIGGEVSRGDLEAWEINWDILDADLDMFSKVPMPVYIFWANKWMAYMKNSVQMAEEVNE